MTFAGPRRPPFVKLAANSVEEAMAEDSAEIEPGLLGNNRLNNATFFAHAAFEVTSVRNPLSISIFSPF